MNGLKVKTLIFAVACLCMAFSTAVFASTLSWNNAPISGINVDTSFPGQFTINTDPTLITIPNYVGPDPSKTVFWYNPVVCCISGHLYDPSMAVWFASAVNVDPLDSYHYTGVWSFLGNGPNAPYSFTWPENDWNPGTGFTIAELYSSVYQFWAEDAGNWQYTETWTGTSGADLGASITSTRDFEVRAVPEPASMLLLGSGLLGLALLRKLKK